MKKMPAKTAAETKSQFPGTVDEYLATVPPAERAILEKLRKTVRAAAPKAEETISYQMPAYKYFGHLVGFAAFKNHSTFFVMSGSFLEAHKDLVKGFETAKSGIHFTAERPLPSPLVRKIVKLRLRENIEKAGPKTRKAAK